jgi:TPR repeat protein
MSILGYSAIRPALAAAEQIITAPSRTASFEDAKKAYDQGDKNLALAYGKIAASGGDIEAQILVGHILMRGETGLIDYIGAAEAFQQAALKDHPDALVALAELALRSQGGLTPPQAIGWLERAAELGRHDAMRVLATVYETGGDLPTNLKQAEYWRGKAASDGDALAARAMGDEAAKHDAFEALTWYEHAAILGDAQSAYIAAIMYAENFEIRPDEKKAARLMQQAAAANLPAAMADYGLLVYQGAGVEKDIKSAAKWFERAAKAGDSEGQFLYAFTLAKGEGVTKSFEDAYYWLLRSGESGVDDYDKDRTALRERLEANIDEQILNRARSRFRRTLPQK